MREQSRKENMASGKFLLAKRQLMHASAGEDKDCGFTFRKSMLTFRKVLFSLQAKRIFLRGDSGGTCVTRNVQEIFRTMKSPLKHLD